jgi:hypothetical protein
MHEVQAAYIGSGGAGDGTLNFRGRSYPLNVGGISGIDLSTVEARGEGLQAAEHRAAPGDL